MSIFTKTGDEGETSLFGGTRVLKSSSIISAIGDVDELCASVAILANKLENAGMKDLSDKVWQIIDQLFSMGADLANFDKKYTYNTESLEQDMIEWDELLPRLTNFVLPSGDDLALSAYFARAICRRAERSVLVARKHNEVNIKVGIFLNRLADWLFECFRLVNHRAKKKEKYWTEHSK